MNSFRTSDLAMDIIDAQIHCWYPNTPQRPWPEGAVSWHGPEYTIEAARKQMDDAGVARAILVPPPWTGWDVAYSLAAARVEPDRFGVVALFDVSAPDARERLRGWRQPGMLGARVTLDRAPFDGLLVDRGLDWFWETSQQDRLPLTVYLPGQLKALLPVLGRFPHLRLVIDHAGRRTKGGIKDEALWTDAQELYALARYPNVAVKVSSMPSFSTQAYPFRNLHHHIRAIYDAFGPQRMVWGSDVTRLTSSYEDNLRLFSEALDFLSREDKRWILGQSAAQCFDWPV